MDADLGVNSVNSLNSVQKLERQQPNRFGVEDSCIDKDCVEKLGWQPPSVLKWKQIVWESLGSNRPCELM